MAVPAPWHNAINRPLRVSWYNEEAGRPNCDAGPSGFHIFLSYRHKNKDQARTVKDTLQEYGYNVFMDTCTPSRTQIGPFRFRNNYSKDNAYILANTPVLVLLMCAQPEGEFERILHPDDFVRHDLKAALASGRCVVPLYDEEFGCTPHLVDNFAALATDLKGLVGGHAPIMLNVRFFEESIQAVHRTIGYHFRKQEAGASGPRLSGEDPVVPLSSAEVQSAPVTGGDHFLTDSKRLSDSLAEGRGSPSPNPANRQKEYLVMSSTSTWHHCGASDARLKEAGKVSIWTTILRKLSKGLRDSFSANQAVNDPWSRSHQKVVIVSSRKRDIPRPHAHSKK